MLVTELDNNKIAGVDIDYLKRGGAIDLSVLNLGARRELERTYKISVLNIPKIFQDKGHAALQLPSSNKYRYALRYGVDTAQRRGKSSSNNFEQNHNEC